MTSAVFQSALEKYRAEHSIDAILTQHGVTLRRTCATNGGEFHGACPRCGGTDRLVVHPRHPCGWGLAWCRQCGRPGTGDALDWSITLAGGEVAERGCRLRYLQGAGYSCAADRNPNHPNHPKSPRQSRRIPWPAAFDRDPNHPNHPNSVSTVSLHSPAHDPVDRLLCFFEGQLVEPVEAARISSLFRDVGSTRPRFCACLGRVFWRLLTPRHSPWVCGRCHAWPGDPLAIETRTFAN